MAFEKFFASNLFAGLLVAGAAYIVYAIYWELTTGASRRQLIAQRGCLPASREYPRDFIGIKRYLDMKSALKNHTLLESGPGRFARYGNTFETKMLGRRMAMTIEPENLKSIMATDFKSWSLGHLRSEAFQSFFGPGIFSTDGAAWQHSRELLRPNFNRKQIANPATFKSHVNDLLDAIPRDGSTVDLQDLFFRLTMDSATEFLFGESCGTLKPGLSTVSHTKFAECFMRGQEIIGDRARYGGKYMILHKLKQLDHDTKYVHEFVDKYVAKGLAHRAQLDKDPAANAADEESARYTFLSELCKQTQDPIQIRSELLNILLAGRDTTAGLLSICWWIIAQRPDVWTALKAEVDALGGEEPSFEQLKDMKYLKSFFNETLRLYPIVPGNSRTAIRDTVLPVGGGPDGRSPVFVPKGKTVGWSVWTMHRRRDFYGDDADDFKPERWLGEKGLRPGWEYLPFNGGPRICIGQQFALTEASYTTVRMIQAFERVEPREKGPWREWLTLTLASQDGCKVGLTPRETVF